MTRSPDLTSTADIGKPLLPIDRLTSLEALGIDLSGLRNELLAKRTLSDLDLIDHSNIREFMEEGSALCAITVPLLRDEADATHITTSSNLKGDLIAYFLRRKAADIDSAKLVDAGQQVEGCPTGAGGRTARSSIETSPRPCDSHLPPNHVRSTKPALNFLDSVHAPRNPPVQAFSSQTIRATVSDNLTAHGTGIKPALSEESTVRELSRSISPGKDFVTSSRANALSGVEQSSNTSYVTFDDRTPVQQPKLGNSFISPDFPAVLELTQPTERPLARKRHTRTPTASDTIGDVPPLITSNPPASNSRMYRTNALAARSPTLSTDSGDDNDLEDSIAILNAAYERVQDCYDQQAAFLRVQERQIDETHANKTRLRETMDIVKSVRRFQERVLESCRTWSAHRTD